MSVPTVTAATMPHSPHSPHSPQARRAWLGGFNLLPYRDRDTRAARRRLACRCGAAILLGLTGAGAWVAGATVMRARIDAERAALEAQLRQRQPQLEAATRAARASDAGRQLRSQAARIAAPYREAVDLLALLARVREDGVRLDALRVTPAGALVDAHAVSYPAAARWVARIARERQRWTFDVDALQPASGEIRQPGAGRITLRFSVRVRWGARPDDARKGRAAQEGPA
jgi:type IV pilus assembly protein PilN